ncbi:MAG: sigma 54-interacting transcriptional regulator [Planctomycetota bacterium]
MRQLLACLMALVAGVTLAAQDPRHRVPWRIPYQVGRVEIDGILEEWDGVQPVELQSADQVAHEEGGPWRGVNDLSGTLYVSYDAAHLYVAGRVLDNDLVPQAEPSRWHSGDAIELFIDTDLSNDLVSSKEPSHTFDQDDLQIFLMPLNPARAWGAVIYSADPGQSAQYGGAAMTGVRMKHRVLPDRGYEFEAVVPFHNLPGFEPGRRQIGFNLAIDDRDAAGRYIYMTWTGTNPVNDVRQLRPLEFTGALPLLSGPGHGARWYERIGALAPFVLSPLAALGLGALLLHLGSRLARRRPALRRVGQALAVLLLIGGFMLPESLVRWRASRAEGRLDDVVQTLRHELPAMEQGTLGSYRGGERDAAFLSLLAGDELVRKQIVTHACLADLATDGFGEPAVRYPVDGFAVRPYWIPLPATQAERFSFAEPLRGGAINVVLWSPAFRGDDATPLRVSLLVEGSEEPQVLPLEPQQLSWASAFPLGYPSRDIAFAQLRLERPVVALEINALDNHNLGLVGLTEIAAPDAEGTPLYLGQASLGGVETDLRGPYPAQAGLLLGAGATGRVRIDPDRSRGFEKLWLFYKADHPGSDHPLPPIGERVAEVVLRFADGEEPRVIDLRHQESVFFEVASHNLDAEPRDDDASVAFLWEGEDQERRLNLEFEIDLPPRAAVTEIVFRNVGSSYPIRFRSAVFRRSQQTVRGEPIDSPLRLTDEHTAVRLQERVRERVEGASFAIYRSGELEETSLEPAPANLPLGLERQLSADRVEDRVVGNDDVRVYESYFPLAGEGWANAVLGVFVHDREHGSFARSVNRLGLLLCLLVAPVLLLLLGDLVATLNSLRFRLMAVLTAAAVVPLVALSLVLVGVLESGHEERLHDGMHEAMGAATRRLLDQQAELTDSAAKWLQPLVDEVEAWVAAGPVVDSQGELEAKLRATLQRQQPPDWDVGSLRFEVVRPDPAPGIDVVEGDLELQAIETPLRTDPGLYIAWGIPFIGVRWEERVEGVGLCSLSVARRIDQAMLRGLAPGKGVIICDARGYPLSAAGEGSGPDRLLHSGVRPALLGERRDALTRVLDGGQPVVVRHQTAGERWVAAYDVLRDQEETPRALLGVLEADQDATLPLRSERVPVRAYFAAVGGLLLLLSVFLSYVVTARITQPIERLEGGAQALGRGEFDVQIDTQEGGQIGRLTRSFNRMAQDLRSRMQDLSHLNRGIQDLNSRLGLTETVTSAIGFCARHSAADRVCLLLRDAEVGGVQGFGGLQGEVDADAPEVRMLLGAVGPLSLILRSEFELGARLPGCGSAVALPLILGGRSRGVILLAFHPPVPTSIHLELLRPMSAQIAVAVENARLYRHAAEDLQTGALLPDYFRRRVAAEVQRAEEDGRPAALLQLEVANGHQLAEASGPERFGRVMERVAAVVRRGLPEDALVCRSGAAALQALIPGGGRDDAARHVATAAERVAGADLELPAGWPRLHVTTASAVYPEDAASAEFLFHALQHRRSNASALPLRQRMQELEAEGLVFRSPAMQSVFRTLERVAPTDLTLLLEGETGTGKEILADLVHRWSRRGQGPLVKVHCAALPEALLQSELFGHERGAFTGAVARKIGKFELAQSGTIFLDEIGEISLDTQVKLLRVLQEHEIERVGGLESVSLDVRVIAATHRNIREMVAQGQFREDLYYRLQGMMVSIPPLRERKQEIPGLVERFRQEAAAAGHTRVRGFHPDALDELFQRDWVGNVRELRNAVFRALVLAGGQQVRREDLLGVLTPAGPGASEDAGEEFLPPGGGDDAAEPPSDGPPDELPVVLPALPPAAPRPGRAPALTGRMAEACRLLRERRSLSTPEYCELVGVSPRTGLRDLGQLVERGLAERTGKRRGARYQWIGPI